MKNIFILALLTLISTGCSGLKTYPNDLTKNLTVITQTDSRMFNRVYPSLHIYDIDKTCALTYIGTIELKNEITEVGLPSGQTNYFSFEFTSKNWSVQRSTAMGVLLDTKKKTHYKVAASYKDNIYNIEIFKKRGKKYREIEHKTHSSCKPEA